MTTEAKNKQTTLETRKFKSRHSLTVLLMVVAGFLTFFFLASGSMSDNRFGTHLVMSADLTSSPAWYALTIMYISIIMCIGGFILFMLLYRGKLTLSESQEKIIRIGSLAIIGSAAFYIALSSITFAVFNTDFFTNTIGPWRSFMPVHMLGGTSITTHYAVQGVVIASLSIVTIVSIMATTLFLVLVNKEVTSKAYYAFRNGTVLLITIGWAIFTINLMAFGAMGGDASILINGVLSDLLNKDINIKFDDLGDKINDLGTIDDPKQAFIYLIDEVLKNGLDLPLPDDVDGKNLWTEGWIVGFPKWWNPLWQTGITDAKDILGFHLPALSLSSPLQAIIKEEVTPWLSQLHKSSIFEGVNESVPAILLFITLLLTTSLIPLYMFFDYKNEIDNKSVLYNFAIYTIIGVTAVYGISAWIIPYLHGLQGYNPLINGLINGEGNGYAPGLIAPAGEFGGINGAIVYFSPYYHGTVTWWILFVLTLLVPIISFTISAYKWYLISKGKVISWS